MINTNPKNIYLNLNTDNISIPGKKVDKCSPCVRNCCLDENDICIGCFRSMEEIMQWANLDEEQKKQILNKVELRKKQIK